MPKENVISAGNAPSTDSDQISQIAKGVREFLAIAIWTIIVVQIAVMDLGGYVSARVPAVAWVSRFRVPFILGTISASWIVLGKRHFMRFAGYVIAYPFVVVFWIVPRLIFRNWAVLVAFSPAIHSILSTFRINFIFFSAGTISSFLIVFTPYSVFIVSAMVFIAVYLLVHYIRRFKTAFSPSSVFADLSGALRRTWNQVPQWQFTSPPKDLDPNSNEYKEKVGQNLLSMYLLTNGLYIVADKLRSVVKSRKLDLYFTGSLVYTFLLTTFVFALEYLGLERFSPGSFSGITRPGFLDFLGFSFSTLMTSDISPLKPASGLAQTACYGQLFGSLLIVVLLVFVIMTSIRERYKQDLDGLVDELGDVSGKVGEMVVANYELTIGALEAHLFQAHPGLVRSCLVLRYGEAKATEMSNLLEKPPPSPPENT